MLAAFVKSNEESSNCAKLLGTGAPKKEGGLISHNTSLISASDDGCGFDTCSFLSDPSDADIMAFCESGEMAGSLAFFDGSESCGSIAFSGGGESCGSIASSGGGSFSGGGCSYSC